MDREQLRSFCLSLPAVTEDVKRDNDLCFSVGGKMFCVASLDPPFSCAFKVRDEMFAEMSSRDGFMPAPYMARARWVKVNTPGKLLRKEWQDLVRDSYEMIKAKLTKKARMELGLQ